MRDSNPTPDLSQAIAATVARVTSALPDARLRELRAEVEQAGNDRLIAAAQFETVPSDKHKKLFDAFRADEHAAQLALHNAMKALHDAADAAIGELGIVVAEIARVARELADAADKIDAECRSKGRQHEVWKSARAAIEVTTRNWEIIAARMKEAKRG